MAFVENFDAAEASPTEFGQKMSLTNPTTLLLSSPEPDADTFAFCNNNVRLLVIPLTSRMRTTTRRRYCLANLRCLLENQHFWCLNYLVCVRAHF